MATQAEPPITAHEPDLAGQAGRRGAQAMWAAGLVVVTGAGVLTAHGLTEVALGSTVGARIAWLYLVITDSLALVAYTATTRLAAVGRRYAWSVVVLAAGLSALAQAVFLAGGAPQATPLLRGVVGAWPAVAAAIAAHLFFLIRTDQRVDTALSTAGDTDASTRAPAAVQPQPSVVPGSVQGGTARVSIGSDVQGVQPPASNPAARPPPVLDAGAGGGREPGLRRAWSPIDRARTAAMLHHREVGRWPSARQLAALAQVGRGTAHTAIQQLSTTPAALHLVTDQIPRRRLQHRNEAPAMSISETHTEPQTPITQRRTSASSPTHSVVTASTHRQQEGRNEQGEGHAHPCIQIRGSRPAAYGVRRLAAAAVSCVELARAARMPPEAVVGWSAC